jgi:hypothetical protein
MSISVMHRVTRTLGVAKRLTVIGLVRIGRLGFGTGRQNIAQTFTAFV